MMGLSFSFQGRGYASKCFFFLFCLPRRAAGFPWEAGLPRERAGRMPERARPPRRGVGLHWRASAPAPLLPILPLGSDWGLMCLT
jgi:hypothetical protein